MTVEVGLTLSPRQYESVRVHAAATVELAEGDDVNAALQSAKDRVTETVVLHARDISNSMK